MLRISVYLLASSFLLAPMLSGRVYGQSSTFTAVDLVEIIPSRGGRWYFAPYMKWPADADIDLYVVQDPADDTCIVEAIDEIQRSVVDIRRVVPGLGRLGDVRAVTQVPQATGRPSIILALPTADKSIKVDFERFAKAHSPTGVRFERGGVSHVYHGVRSSRQPDITAYDFDIVTTVVAVGRFFALGYSWTINDGGFLWTGPACQDEEWAAPLYATLGAINFDAAGLLVKLREHGIDPGPRKYSKLRLAFLRVLYGQQFAVADPNTLRIHFANFLNDPSTYP